MGIGEMNILIEKLIEIKRYLPNDVYLNNLYKELLIKKTLTEKKSLNVNPTNREKAKFFYVITVKSRKLNVKLKNNWKDLWNYDKELFARKIILSREVDNAYCYNNLQLEANNLLNTLIYEDFLNQLQNLKSNDKRRF
jgi:hypothetical protein